MGRRSAKALILGAWLGLWPGAASAAWEVGLGLVDEIDGRRSSLATLGWRGDSHPEWEILIGHLRARDPDGGTAVSTPTTSFVATSRRYAWGAWFLSGGVALADTDADNPVLSGPIQFMTGIGWQGRRWSISVRHLSNANTRGENRGETFLLLGYHG